MSEGGCVENRDKEDKNNKQELKEMEDQEIQGDEADDCQMTDSDFGTVALLALPSQLLCSNCLFRLIKFPTLSHSQCPGCLWSPLPLADRRSCEFFL